LDIARIHTGLAARSDLVVRGLIIVVGLMFWVVGSNIHDVHFFAVDIGPTLAELGFLISVLTLFHWIYESKVRDEIVQDIVVAATGSNRLAGSGMVDYVPNARKIEYAPDLLQAKSVIVCVHYSPRFLEDNFPIIAGRSKGDQRTTVVALKEESASLQYLLSARGEHDHIQPNIRKIRSLVERLKDAGANVELVEHDTILRYSFVKMDGTIWLKFYRNSPGMAEIPAVRVREGSSLFEFLDEDISSLIGAAA
jgi:hypothetical protein